MDSSGCYKMSLPCEFDIFIDRQSFVKLSLESMLQMMGQSVSSRILKFKSRENKIYLSLFA